MNSRYYLLIILLTIVCFAPPCLAWKTTKNKKVNKDGTHQILSEYAADFSILRDCPLPNAVDCDVLKKNLGFTDGLDERLVWGSEKPIKDWIKNGSENEDAGTLWNMIVNTARFVNHFHNPRKPMRKGVKSPVDLSHVSV